MVGMSLVLPVIPLYAEKFTVSPFVITLLYSIFAVCSFLALPILGSLSDKFGRKPVLVMSILGSSMGWIIFALGNKLWILFLGRMIDGATAGNVSVAQSYLTDISEPGHDRIKKLSLIPTALGIGFITGPAIGGVLSKISMTLPFWIAAAITLMNGVIALIFLPESIREKQHHLKISKNPFGSIMQGLATKKYRLILFLVLLTSMAFESYHSTFILYVNRAFGLEAHQAGLVLSGVGVVIALNQIFLLKKWIRNFTPFKIQIITVSILIGGFTLLALMPLPAFLSILAITAICEGTLTIINASELSTKADECERGKIIGISHSLLALAQITSPTITSSVMEKYLRAPWFIPIIWLTIILMVLTVKKRELKKQEIGSIPPIQIT
jgi:DHA1 family tetracycline resistance protein-like MFS transporter